MYESFRVQNFRCFEDIELKDLARINLIGGENNTGKTSLLEAICFYAGGIHKDLILRFEQNSAAMTLFDWGRLFFKFNKFGNTAFLVKEDGRSSKVSLYIQGASQQEIFQYAAEKERSFIQVITQLEIKEGIRLKYQGGEAYYLVAHDKGFLTIGYPPPVPAITFLPAKRTNYIANSFSKFVIGGKKGVLIGMLKILEPRIRDIEELSGMLFVTLEGLANLLPLTDMGEGMQRITELVIGLNNAENGLFLMDEIENGLHYSIMPTLWRAIYDAAVEFNVQLFATTHSGELISAAHQVFAEMDTYDFRYYRLQRDPQNQVQVITFDEQKMTTAEEAGFEVR